MTVEEFYAFTDARPDEEKWELIDGEPILNASAQLLHQQLPEDTGTSQRSARVTGTAGSFRTANAGLGVRVSDTGLPVPDVMRKRSARRIAPRSNPLTRRECDDMIVAFEVRSPSTSDRDLRWKRTPTRFAVAHAYVMSRGFSAKMAVFARARA